MTSCLPAAVLCLLCGLHVCFGVQFLLAVPKEVYYDVDLVVSVSAFGFVRPQTETVSLEFKGQKDPSKVLNSTSLQFTSDGLQVYRVKFTWERIYQLDETGVMIVMSSGEHESRKTLTFTQNFGYIFIQTDKPVYTPLQTVKFRVIAVDEHQKLAKYTIRIDIRNHKQIVVDRFTQTAEEAFRAKEFPLPRDTPPGQWSITANFEGVGHTLGANHMVTFDVKEYVLPRFSSVVSVDPDVITHGTKWITVNVTSRYVYGRPVFGSVELKLGIWTPSGISMLPVNFTQPLENGTFNKDIKVDSLFPSNLPYTRSTRLYVKATVTESASLESYVYEDTSTFITDPYYVMGFKSKKHFKPGFPYTLQLQVSAQSGRPASWVRLYINPIFTNKQGQKIGGAENYYTLDDHGEMTQEFVIPKNTHQIIFTALIVDPKLAKLDRYTFQVYPFQSLNNEYIHISVTSLIKENQDGELLLQYTQPKQSFSNKPDNITVLVLAKGHVIFTTTSVRNLNGRSHVILPSHIYTEISPKMRIVAYYYVQSGTPEFVIDSLLVDTPDVCLEEIALILPGSSALYKPKDIYTLEVEGGPEMNVGFVAVDKAVFLLSDKSTLNRNLLFSQLGSHDKGENGGDGSTAEEVLENSGLHHMTLDLNQPVTRRPSGVVEGRNGDNIHFLLGSFDPTISTAEEVPPQTVRKDFPESWFFEERKLPKSGQMEVSLQLPDSITTWSFMAVGVSSTRGICVSRPLDQPVRKLFFTDVRLPYKVTRLEEVKVKIAVYNYHIYAAEVLVTVTGSDGLCFSANTIRGSTQNSTSFRLSIPAQQARGGAIKVIPLRNGDLTLRVDVQSQNERDVVEKQLHVVAEGLRVRKSMKFVLDPEAKHATFRPSRHNKTVLYETSTISNVFDLKNKEQQTTIDLALPSNAIRGTESCRISAFGDLMGDIITHAVVESRNLIDTPLLDAEEVLGDLAPTIHALLSARSLGLMDETLTARGRRFVRHGVTRLLKYRNDDYSFSLTPDSKPCTWLTAFALKTLCHATSLAFIDRNKLIYEGFDWLLDQVKSDGSLMEQDKRLAKHVVDHNLMLSAEVLITIMECDSLDEKTHLNLQDGHLHLLESHLRLKAQLSSYLRSNLDKINDPLALAKVAYALMLFDPMSQEYLLLNQHKKRNKHGHIYWSKVEETNEAKTIPFWYCKVAHASAIEATAYALLVFLEKGGTNTDAIADWLVGQRNYNGAFIGAMDSTAAIQALSKYSLQKHGHDLNLHCNVSSSRQQEYFHSFKFTEENALNRESLNNVPVGQVLDVHIRGQGLGQMQVNVEYNIPIDKNENCRFKITIDVKKTMVRWSEDMDSNPLCASCDIGCPKPVSEAKPLAVQTLADVSPAAKVTVKVNNTTKGGKPGKRKCKPRQTNEKGQREQIKKPKPGVKKCGPKAGKKQASKQHRRSVEYNQVASKKSICIHVCFLHLQQGTSSPIEARIDMLSGYHPVLADIQMMKKVTNVRHVVYDNVQNVLKVQFSGISCTQQTCLAFRAVDEEEVERLLPANVEVIQIGTAAPQCVMEYNGTLDSESLRVYCADFSHENRGECRCYSGLCSHCKPVIQNELSLIDVKQLACQKPIAYQLQIANVTNMGNWMEINSRVVSLNKTGSDNITAGSIIKLMSPSSCGCPVYHYKNSSQKFYMLSTDVDRLVDRNGNSVYSYILDEQSLFLRVSEPGITAIAEPSVPYFYLQQALNNNRC